MMVRVLITAAMRERAEMVPTEKKIVCCVCFAYLGRRVEKERWCIAGVVVWH